MIPIRQNVDRNARQADFQLASDQMLIASMFKTIQGEGPFAGHHAYFIRTSGCNFGGKDVACAWCDTSFKISDGKVMTFEEIEAEVKASQVGHAKPLIVLTGGEPLLQPYSVYFIKYMLDRGYNVQVETNGSFLNKLSPISGIYVGLHIVCSPKQLRGKYSSQPPTFNYLSSRNSVHFKFVVSADPETGHNVLPDWASSVSANVWVSPMTVYKKEYHGEVSSIWDRELVDQDLTSDNYRYATKLVMDNPRFKFTCQLHTLMAIA